MTVRAACRPLPRASRRALMAWIRLGTRCDHDGHQIRASWRWNRWLANRATSSSAPLAALMVINPSTAQMLEISRENIIHLERQVSTRAPFGTGAGTADGAIVDWQPQLRHQLGHLPMCREVRRIWRRAKGRLVD